MLAITFDVITDRIHLYVHSLPGTMLTSLTEHPARLSAFSLKYNPICDGRPTHTTEMW